MITPGPWKAFTWRSNRGASVITDTLDANEAGLICELSKRRNVDAIDNSRLIAASPDLLAACKAALELLEILPMYRNGDTAKMIRAVIAKVEGE